MAAGTDILLRLKVKPLPLHAASPTSLPPPSPISPSQQHLDLSLCLRALNMRSYSCASEAREDLKRICMIILPLLSDSDEPGNLRTEFTKCMKEAQKGTYGPLWECINKIKKIYTQLESPSSTRTSARSPFTSLS